MIPLWLVACGGDPVERGPGSVDLPQGTVGPSSSAPVTSPAPGAGRPWRRMNIDQLKASLVAVSGGIDWEEDGASVLDDLAATLGKPDYSQSTREDLTPNLLFQKFLDDDANYTCTTLLAREAGSPDGHVFLVQAALGDTFDTAPDAMNANLAYLVLRFHGRSLPPESVELEPWRFLFDSVLLVTDGDTAAAWRAVCVGLVTHPDFYLY